MIDEKPGEEKKKSPQTLTDDQVVTDRKMPRRSFLAATGALLLGAAAVATGTRAGVLPQQGSDPDSKKGKQGDPDSKKKTGKKTSTKKSKKKTEKAGDPDSKKKPG